MGQLVTSAAVCSAIDCRSDRTEPEGSLGHLYLGLDKTGNAKSIGEGVRVDKDHGVAGVGESEHSAGAAVGTDERCAGSQDAAELAQKLVL